MSAALPENHEIISDECAIGSTVVSSSIRPSKKPYSTPMLRVFGQVHRMTHGASGTVGDGQGMQMLASDRRLKERIVRIGTHPELDVGLYLFNYRPEFAESLGGGRHFGVMADEVESVRPEAVSVGSNGYKQVRYDLLGIRPI